MENNVQNGNEQNTNQNNKSKGIPFVVLCLILLIFLGIGAGLGIWITKGNKSNQNNVNNATPSNSSKTENTIENKTENKTKNAIENKTENKTENVIENKTENKTENITKETENTTKDFSAFANFKSYFYRNTDYVPSTPDIKDYCELKFDAEGVPTIKMGTKDKYTTECHFNTLEITSIKTDVAAGTTYVTIEFKAWSAGGDTTGSATIKYSNVADNTILGVKAEVQYDGKVQSFDNNGDYIEVTKINVTGRKFVNDFVGEKPYPSSYIYGRDFVNLGGTSERTNIYYIDEDDTLCVTEIGSKSITCIATNITKLIGDPSSGRIYAYTNSKFTDDNIFEKKDNIVYRKAE